MMQAFDLNLLPVAHALLSERSVTRAAARLHLSVPAASRALDRCRSTFDDPLLHHALPEVSVVRVDVEVFSVEMGELGMMREAHPWFFLLDAEGRPSAAVSADAWQENVPMNVAKGLRDWLDDAKEKPSPGTIAL